MRKNVGTLDAMLRITFGLLGLSYGIGRMARRPSRTPWFLMSMSAMKVAEGVTRFCPMLAMFGRDTKKGMNLAGLAMKMVLPTGKQEMKHAPAEENRPTSEEPKKRAFNPEMITNEFITQLQQAEGKEEKSDVMEKPHAEHTEISQPASARS